jgi:predicted ArsR family transcriptional regulator
MQEWVGSGLRVYGTDTMALERVIAEHLGTHAPMDFTKTISRLRTSQALVRTALDRLETRGVLPWQILDEIEQAVDHLSRPGLL